MKTILVVDDEVVLADTLSAILQHSGYQSIAVYGAAEAQQILRERTVDLLISDVMMPDINGFELAIHTTRNHPDTRILLISGNAATQELLNGGADQYHFELLAKPIPPKQLLEHVKELLARSPLTLNGDANVPESHP